jgi:hypothetical protein
LVTASRLRFYRQLGEISAANSDGLERIDAGANARRELADAGKRLSELRALAGS